jgi:hypothetical protein
LKKLLGSSCEERTRHPILKFITFKSQVSLWFRIRFCIWRPFESVQNVLLFLIFVFIAITISLPFSSFSKRTEFNNVSISTWLEYILFFEVKNLTFVYTFLVVITTMLIIFPIKILSFTTLFES